MYLGPRQFFDIAFKLGAVPFGILGMAAHAIHGDDVVPVYPSNSV